MVSDRLVGVDDEIAQDVEETRRRKHALEQHLEGRPVRDDVTPVNGLPRCIMLESASEGTHRRTGAIRDDCDDVGNEYTRDLTPISLDLVPGIAESGVLISRVLQLQQANGQTVEENEHVGSAVVAGLDNGELVESSPIVVPRGIEVHEPQAHGGGPAILTGGLDRHAAHHQLIESLVLTHAVL